MADSTQKTAWQQATERVEAQRKLKGSTSSSAVREADAARASAERKAANKAARAQLLQEAGTAWRFVKILGFLVGCGIGAALLGWLILIPLGIGAAWGLAKTGK